MLPVIGHAIFSFTDLAKSYNQLVVTIYDKPFLTALPRENLSTQNNNVCLTEKPSKWCQKNKAGTLQ